MSAPYAGDSTLTGMHAAADLAPGTVVCERFRIIGLLGIGGMGVVYRAHDEHLGIDVALKLIRAELATREDALERFRREILLARQVTSPHVVRIHDIAQHQGRWLISMDLVEGETLDRMLERRGQLPVDEVVSLLRQLALGLSAAHRVGVVHRDLKPANILVDASGQARISDFGVARSIGAAGTTGTGMVVGTPDYLSPEQARAAATGPASDLYTLGLIAYEMLSGRLPFEGATPAESALQRAVRAPPLLSGRRSGLPAWLVRLVDRLLQPEPRRRLRDADAVVEAIDRREVRRAWPNPLASRRALLAAATIAALALASWLLYPPWGGAPASLDRIAVLALPSGASQEPAGQHAALREALAEHLRTALAAAGAPGVVDAERTAATLEQLGISARGRLPPRRELLAALNASRLVVATWESQPGGSGRLQVDVGASGPELSFEASDLVEAYRAALAPVVVALGLEAEGLPGLPQQTTALAAFGDGLLQRRQGRLSQAAQSFTTATVAAPAFMPAWLGLVQATRDAGRSEAALGAAIDALRGSGPARDSLVRQQLQALRSSLEGDSQAARELLAQLLARQPADTRLVLELAQEEADAGDLEQASRRIDDQLALDPDDARLWFLRGKLAIIGGDARSAVDDHLVRALVLFNRSRNLPGRADSYNALGVGFERLGQLDQALDNYHLAIELRRELDDARGLATSLRNLAAILAIRGETDQAAERLGEARVLLEELRDRHGLAALDNDLGLLAEERGDHASALEHYRAALQRRQSLGVARDIAESLNNVGFAHYLLGAYDNAQAYWQQALQAQESIGDGGATIRLRQNLALLDLARGYWRQAEDILSLTLQQARQAQMVEEAAVSLRYLAELNLLADRIDDANDALREAGALFEERQDQRGLADVRLLQVRSLLVAGDSAGARSTVAEELAMDLPRTPDQRSELLLTAVESAFASGEADDARRLLDAARRTLAQSDVAALQLRLALLEAEVDRLPAGDLVERARRLDNAALRLQAIEYALEQGAHEPQAQSLRQEATVLLRRTGRWWRQQRLGELGVVIPHAAPEATPASDGSADGQA